MKTEFNHAANDSPRSGGNKSVAPTIWAAIVIIAVVTVVWLVMPR